MLLPHDIPTMLYLAAAMFVAGLARGFSGFGAALIFVPLAASLIGPQAAAPILLVTDGIMTAPLVRAVWATALKPAVGLMAIGGLLGIPAGTALLVLGDPLTLRWCIAALTALMLALLASGWRYHGKPHAAATIGVGVISGVFSGVAQIGGPPVVAYWLGGGHDAARMRASTIVYFAFSSIVTVATYIVGALFTREIIVTALIMAPVYGAGVYLGSKVFPLASADTFRRICLGLIALALVLSLPLWG